MQHFAHSASTGGAPPAHRSKPVQNRTSFLANLLVDSYERVSEAIKSSAQQASRIALASKNEIYHGDSGTGCLLRSAFRKEEPCLFPIDRCISDASNYSFSFVVLIIS